jgi:RimJ/RimL family protein N-acetyltransferase
LRASVAAVKESRFFGVLETDSTVVSSRLELVSLSPDALEALLEGRTADAEALVGGRLGNGWPGGHERFFRLRLGQMQRDPSLQPWLVRALVLRHGREVVGHAGFHGPPGVNGKQDPEAVEMGYEVFEQFRGQGLATEATQALICWAREEHCIRRFILSIAPANDPSLAIARRLGFVQTGEQWDEEDGLELVFELEA